MPNIGFTGNNLIVNLWSILNDAVFLSYYKNTVLCQFSRLFKTKNCFRGVSQFILTAALVQSQKQYEIYVDVHKGLSNSITNLNVILASAAHLSTIYLSYYAQYFSVIIWQFFSAFLTQYFPRFFSCYTQVLMKPSFMLSIRKYPLQVLFHKKILI